MKMQPEQPRRRLPEDVPMETVRAAAPRLWAAVSKGDDCWTWTGGRDRDGYGLLTVGSVRFRVHRLSYILDHDAHIPPGMLVMHRCDNPPCVRPDHLRLGTNAENTADRHAKNRDARNDGTRFPRGEQHHLAKLTRADVLAIREAHRQGAFIRALARRYGVAQGSIRGVVRRESWKDVE